MSKLKKVITGGFSLLAIGYALGILTAPKSGKQTRKRLRKTAKNSMYDMERDLKTIYSQTKNTLDQLAKDNPTLSSRYNNAKDLAEKSQHKLKGLISAIHGHDNVDEDLEAALKDAKSALMGLKSFLKK